MNQPFAVGSRWQFDMEFCDREGLVVRNATYTPRNGSPIYILFRGSIAQIHVPYSIGTPRFRDLTVSTAGLGVWAQGLTAGECPGGALLHGNRVCRQLEDRGYAWKYGSGVSSYVRGQEVKVFISSQLGEYNYIQEWNFRDDGVIEPRAGLTGRLQIGRSGDGYLPFGGRLNPESAPTPSVGISHMHNIYYRLDFDIGGSANDSVEQLTYQNWYAPSPETTCEFDGQCHVNVTSQFFNETYDVMYPWNYTSWRIFDTVLTNPDGRTIGYEIVPHITGQWYGMYAAGESWSYGDLWITTYNGCELLATDNFPPYIPSGCAGLVGESVTDFIADAAPVDSADIVVWYANRFMHKPRDEDQDKMPIEWMGFEIVPRNLHHHSPLEP